MDTTLHHENPLRVRMFGQLLRKEILEYFLSARFAVLGALSICFVLWSFYDGLSYYQDRLAEFGDGEAGTQERMRQFGDPGYRFNPAGNNWNEAFGVGYDIHVPPPVLSILERGLDPFQGRSMHVKSGADRWLKQSPAAGEPTLAVFNALDLGSTVRVVLGLFALLLSFDAICGDRERGTLRLLSTFPVSGRALVGSKIIGASAPLMCAFLVATLIGLAAVAVNPNLHLGTDLWIRVAVYVATSCLYLAVMVAAGVLCSALVRSPAASLLLLLVFWTSTAILIPRFGPILADKVSKAPSVAGFEAAIRSLGIDDRAGFDREQQAYKNAYESEHGQTPNLSHEGTVKYYTFTRDRGRERTRARRVNEKKLHSEFVNQHRVWLQLSSLLARVSPAFTHSSAGVRLSGTGLDRHDRAYDASVRQLDAYMDWVDLTWYADVFKGFELQGEQRSRIRGPSGQPPQFLYDSRPRLGDIASATVDIGVLLIWGIVLGVGAFIATIRYDRR